MPRGSTCCESVVGRSEWAECDATCNGGQQFRSRYLQAEAQISSVSIPGVVMCGPCSGSISIRDSRVHSRTTFVWPLALGSDHPLPCLVLYHVEHVRALDWEDTAYDVGYMIYDL